MSSEPRSVCPECHAMAVVNSALGHKDGCGARKRFAEPTVEECLRELREMFPEIDGLQVSEHAWYWKERGRIQRSARVLLGPEYNAPTFSTEGEAPLTELMSQIRRHKENKPNG